MHQPDPNDHIQHDAIHDDAIQDDEQRRQGLDDELQTGTTEHDPATAAVSPDAAPVQHGPAQPAAGRSVCTATWTVVLVVALAVLVVVVLVATLTPSAHAPAPSHTPHGASDRSTTAAFAHAQPLTPRPVTNLHALTPITTFSTVADAPTDLESDQDPTGDLVHPTTPVPVYLAPGQAAIGLLDTTQVGSPTWLPVIATEPGWVQVLLPSRPAHSTGWISTTPVPQRSARIAMAHTDLRIIVDRTHAHLTLVRRLRPDGPSPRNAAILPGDQVLANWQAGVGTTRAPTPTGRTFVLAVMSDPSQRFSPIILPLGTHSQVHQRYGDGPGTIGLHSWPTTTVFGHPSSAGCVRIPAQAVQQLATQAPIGTPVLIS